MSLYALADCRHGRFLYNVNDEYIGRSLQTYGEWSEQEAVLFRQIVRPGDMVVEAGANIGSHTVFLSGAVGPGGRVLAFEPARLTAQLLCANLALNECLNVQVYQQAVGDHCDRVQFPVLDPTRVDNFGGVSLHDAPRAHVTETVSMISIDSLHLDRLDLLKTDIEGYEPDLLRGAQETIRRCRPVIYVELDWRNGERTGNRDELVGLVEPLGYAAYYFLTPMYNPHNFRGAPKVDPFGGISTDLLCVPTERVALEGLTQARVGDGSIDFDPPVLTYAVLPCEGVSLRFL